MKHVKIYEDWDINNVVTCYSDVLWEYQGIYFIEKNKRFSSFFVSVEIIPEDVYETIADEVYQKSIGKSISTFNGYVTDSEIDLFVKMLNNLKYNHMLIILSYIVDKFYNTNKSSKNAKRLLSNFDDYFDDIQDNLYTKIGGVLGNTVDEAMMKIDSHFMGDEIGNFNL